MFELVVKRNDIVLVLYTEYTGNFQEITIELMKRMESDTKKTYEVFDCLFQFINEEVLTVLYISSKDAKLKLANIFLADVRKRLL
jgi:hypothetical protein